jgi:hypothetical protein
MLYRVPQLVPQRAGNPKNWVEQQIEIDALVDAHLVGSRTPVGTRREPARDDLPAFGWSAAST